jgi:hypothetical protein
VVCVAVGVSVAEEGPWVCGTDVRVAGPQDKSKVRQTRARTHFLTAYLQEKCQRAGAWTSVPGGEAASRLMQAALRS